MRRDPRLHGLSTDHHHALVLARRLRGKVESGAVTEADARALAEQFERELEPHFRAEEELLLPALRELGEDDLVERTLVDHAWLREHAALAAGGRTDVLGPFAQRLHDHVRFEERELFACCQDRLPDAVLDAVGHRVPTR